MRNSFCFLVVLFHISILDLLLKVSARTGQENEENADINTELQGKLLLVQSHLDGHDNLPVNLTNMGEEELAFYKFVLHDFNKDILMDGWELMEAVGHIIDADERVQQQLSGLTSNEKEYQQTRLRYIINAVDGILKFDDKNKDGYISYIEHRNGEMETWASQAYDSKH